MKTKKTDIKVLDMANPSEGVINLIRRVCYNIDDLNNDDSVDVTMYRGKDPLMVDATGAYTSGSTQRVDYRWGKEFIYHLKGKIKDGVLTDYMWDYLRARKEGRPQSGNGRRQSYMPLPMVRMTNTYVLNGTDDPDDIVRSTDYGVYVAKLGGGSVNTASGDFVFGMTEAYLIEHGEITTPLREGNLIGNGPDVLREIDMLGNDFAMGNPGTCGKDGQGVPVGDGQPTLRVKSLTIGGTAA